MVAAGRRRPSGIALLLWLSAAASAEDRFGGPLRFVDAHPFHAVFLDVPALDAALPDGPTVDLRLSQWNTLAIAPSVLASPAGALLQNNLANNRPQQELSAPLLAAWAAANPGQTFLFADTETTRLDLTWLQPIDRRWGFQLDLPLLGHHGGVFDDVIAGFHQMFNYPDLGRPYAPVNRTQLMVASGAETRFHGGPFAPSLGDIVVTGLHAPVRENARDPAVMLSAAVKLPTGAASRFAGSGSWDWSLGLHLARTWGDFRGTFSGGHAWHGPWRGLRSVPIRNTFDAQLGLEWSISDNWAVVAQVARREQALATADRRTFGRPAYNLGTGFRWRPRATWLMEGGFFENLTEDQNSYDVGIQYRVRWQP